MKKPRIRFKGFTEAWEQRKLGELGTITTGSTPSTSIPDYYSDDGIVWVTPTDICENITFESARKLSDLGQQVGRVVPKNTILVTCIASIGKNTMLGNTGSFNQQINGLTPNENKYDPYFLLTESALWSAKMKSSAAAGTMQIVNRTEFSELRTWLPSLIEQQAIGNFFRQLDNLITLHQRKYDKLLNIKKSMLEKMFHKNGNDVPEIRFKGFTDAWEQRKLGDLYTERNEQGDNSLQILSVSIHTGVSDGELTADGLGKKVHRSEDKSTYKHVYAGDLIFNMMRAWQGAIGVAKNEGMTSPAYISAIPNHEVYPPFMNYLLRRKDAINQINNLSYGVTDFRKRLYWNSFIRVTCQLPCVAEQKRIAEVFETIDNLITLHQRKLEKLKNIKKSMLEKMFV